MAVVQNTSPIYAPPGMTEAMALTTKLDSTSGFAVAPVATQVGIVHLVMA